MVIRWTKGFTWSYLAFELVFFRTNHTSPNATYLKQVRTWLHPIISSILTKTVIWRSPPSYMILARIGTWWCATLKQATIAKIRWDVKIFKKLFYSLIEIIIHFIRQATAYKLFRQSFCSLIITFSETTYHLQPNKKSFCCQNHSLGWTQLHFFSNLLNHRNF